MRIKDESGDRKYFTIIPNYILNHSTLWDREVYIQMKRITGEDGTCWTSQSTLSKQCGISVNRLKKSIRYLVEHGWIKQIGKKEVITKGGVQEVNEYRVADLWKTNIDFYESKGVSHENTPLPKGVSRKQQRGITDEPQGVSPGDDKEEPIQEEPSNKIQQRQDVADEINPIIELFKPINPSYAKLFANTTQRAAVKRLLQTVGRGTLEEALAIIPITNGMQYAPTITTPLQLEDKISQLQSFIRKTKDKLPKITKIR